MSIPGVGLGLENVGVFLLGRLSCGEVVGERSPGDPDSGLGFI
jgi:hypothetical protein